MVKPQSGFLTLRGGKFRGKKIPIPADKSVRPTTDRARTQAFALLDQHFRYGDGRARWAGAIGLDAFSGTGALGLEAASRGAHHITFWDTSQQQIRILNETLASLIGIKATTAVQSALTPPEARQRVDLIFLDPPYHRGWIEPCLAALTQAKWIASNTLIYTETEIGSLPPKGYQVLTARESASSCLRLLLPQFG